ncbi:hypothetical protein RRG08_012349 [Elysia crispata]|uniref:Uncharacterized protein n=1 Tax=Elysia crispata TaxID=231223 RepID=A0AAE1ACC8_9GAST|nr:hypothetical protein RRG08_012349 [Elysia crispata]
MVCLVPTRFVQGQIILKVAAVYGGACRKSSPLIFAYLYVIPQEFHQDGCSIELWSSLNLQPSHQGSDALHSVTFVDFLYRINLLLDGMRLQCAAIQLWKCKIPQTWFDTNHATSHDQPFVLWERSYDAAHQGTSVGKEIRRLKHIKRPTCSRM